MSKSALTTPLRVLLAVFVVLSLVPSTSTASTATAFRLPPGNELDALAATSSGSAFVAVFRPFGSGTELSQQGTYVYDVSPTGSVKELPAKISDSNAGLAGIAAAGPGSVWIPGSHHVRLLGHAGVEKEIAVGRAEIESVATDRHGGLWVAAGARIFHVNPSGKVARLRIRPLEPANRATVVKLIEDHGGNLWLAVVRGDEALTTEVIERSPGRPTRTFKVDRPIFGAEAIGITMGKPVIRSGQDFLRLDRSGELSRRVSVPERPCTLTETAEIWCKAWASNSIYRALPKGDPSPVSLPEPGFRVYDLETIGHDDFWYAAENRNPCRAGPSTCIIDTPGTIVVGQITGTEAAS
jgi:hypothetical protein